MSEVNLPALAKVNNDDVKKTPTAMQEVELALKECGFGKFHLQLLFSAFIAFVAGVIVTNSTPYILPVAECDLNMNLVQKGLLNASPYVGMILVSVVGGFLTDTFGRKMFIVGGNLGVCVFTIISATSQTYQLLIAAKFFEGFLFAVSFTPIVTLTSEFCHRGVRDRIMLLQTSFAAYAQIIAALLSWAILPNNWKTTYFDGALVLNTWNFYLLIMSLWSLLAAILYMLLPESPKFYITQRRYDEAREILIRIYRKNTGKPVETFKYIDLWKDKRKHAIDEAPESEMTLREQLMAGFHNVKPMFHKPLALYLLLLCFMNFFTMIMYNVIRLWFPQLSTIVEHYSVDGNRDLCVMLDEYTADQRTRVVSVNFNVTDVCVPAVSGTDTYINSVVLGSICIIPFIVGGILVNKVGKKMLYTTCGLLTVGITLGLRWANTRIAMVALFSSDAAISQTMTSLNQALIVELFPTTTRSLAIGMIMTWGRIGSLVGNVLFPILLDLGCVVPIYTLAATMICITSFSLVLPVKK
ncbi:synaptic vesicle glycoprotein 2C-like [Aricia agestis]|uniref:synaptic vesicle glycoprotein 2C-like n=1 Tax=Aricia agestis TaxID=91739 RepID=UPI001C2071D5|nr:synaptic vesicle glycoprotein 2C-like [Aricia agestis]